MSDDSEQPPTRYRSAKLAALGACATLGAALAIVAFARRDWVLLASSVPYMTTPYLLWVVDRKGEPNVRERLRAFRSE